MKCFTHQGKDAVGVCKACSKGICSECAEDLGHSLACKSSCEEQAHLLDAAIQRSVTTIKATKRNRNFQPAFLAAMGAGFVYYGMDKYPRYEFILMMGIGFLIFAGVNFFAMRKWAQELESKQKESPSH